MLGMAGAFANYFNEIIPFLFQRLLDLGRGMLQWVMPP
jgi:hypothetical protein